MKNKVTKVRSRKTVCKRFKRTSTGKLLHVKTGLNHLLRRKDGSRLRALTNGDELFKGDRKRISQMIGKGL